MSRLIDADALCGEFKRRAVSARNWKERAVMEHNDEAIIRADATLAFLSEVKLTIDNAPTIPIPHEDNIWADGYECGRREKRPTGHWIKHSTYKDVLICSNCNHGSNQVYDTFNFCPNCGADMRGEKE